MDSIFAHEPTQVVTDEVGEEVRSRFEKFIVEFTVEDEPIVVKGEVIPRYVESIRVLREQGNTTLYVDFNHIMSYDQELGEAIELQYFRLTPFLRKAVQNTVKKLHPNYVTDEKGMDREFWVSIHSQNAIYKIRELKTNKIGRLCSMRGTVTRTSEVRPELLYGTFQCMDCRVTTENVEQQFRYTEPIQCKNPGCSNSARWQLNIDKSIFVDWQKVRVQENSEEIPSGSMPRSIDIILRHEEVEKAKAGDKCVFTGTLIVVPDISSGKFRTSGPKSQGNRGPGKSGGKNGTSNDAPVRDVLGIGLECNYKLCFLACSVRPAESKFKQDYDEETEEDILDKFTEEELEEIGKLKNDNRIYQKLINSIAPAVFGHKDVKKGILLMLFGGVHKVTEEGINLRGDINVCVVGDPSVSKSQFLKYVVSFLPRAVYTSGKASSAAGLTATVVKDPDTGEFNIEAGALMLADNGICCIDEFDKMDPKDQVAIHEAMEQQTISIAKAGIHATLNARTSILAAANPIGGRYDRAKTLKANLNVTPAIMSRFDLFFVVLDECEEQSDFNIAKHIVQIHQKKDVALKPELSTAQLQRYIKFAKTLKPQLTEGAKKVLVDYYRKLRQSDVSGHSKTSYRITVRQLESMIRLSEALARAHCDAEVQAEYVEEAASLLRKSIIHVETGDVVFEAPKARAPRHPNSKKQTDHMMEDDDDHIYNVDLGEEEEETFSEPSATDSQEALEASSQESSSQSQPPRLTPTTSSKQQQQSSNTTTKEKVAKPRVTIKYEKYAQVTKMLLLHLHSQNNESGETQKELVQYYLDQVSDGLNSELELRQETSVVKNIIHRMIAKDRTLIVISEASDPQNRVLTVNPNFDVEGLE